MKSLVMSLGDFFLRFVENVKELTCKLKWASHTDMEPTLCLDSESY